MPHPTPRTASPVQLRDRFERTLPEPQTDLDHGDAWQLLVATILSAQSTDKTVNSVTPDLFSRWPTPADLAAAPREEVERVVHSTGFFRRKAAAIQEAAARLRDVYGGQVPRTLDELLTLKGVARKTANLVLGVAYGLPTGFVVDTHASRVARRLGLTTADKPDAVEADLCAAFPRDAWIGMSHRLILHGRYLCTARAPRCAACPVNELCPAREAEPKGDWSARAAAEERRVRARGAE